MMSFVRLPVSERRVAFLLGVAVFEDEDQASASLNLRDFDLAVLSFMGCPLVKPRIALSAVSLGLWGAILLLLTSQAENLARISGRLEIGARSPMHLLERELSDC